MDFLFRQATTSHHILFALLPGPVTRPSDGQQTHELSSQLESIERKKYIQLVDTLVTTAQHEHVGQLVRRQHDPETERCA